MEEEKEEEEEDSNGSRTKAFPARTARRRVGVFHLEPAVKRIQVIQFAACNVKGALGIHHDAHSRCLDEDIPVRRPILQIHFILQTGTPTPDDRHPQHAVRPALLCEEGANLFRRVCG